MADKRRFQVFADWVVETFHPPRVFDVAGGMGMLNQALVERGCAVTTFDLRHKRLPVNYAERMFTLEEPCLADAVVGLHPDGATRVVIEYAAQHRIPFAVVPCCSDNGMSYKPWMRFLRETAEQTKAFATVDEHTLAMDGRARVLWGRP